MLRRTGFKRKYPERAPREESAGWLIKPRAVEPVRATMRPAIRFTEPILKDNPVRSESYRRYVAALPCWRCSLEGYSQAAHADEGKGLALKACDLTCYPACGPHDGLPGCHHFIGTSGSISREDRRALEKQAAADTQLALIAQSQEDPKLRRLLVHLELVR